MKKTLALVMAVIMAAALFCIPAFAVDYPGPMVEMIMSTDGVKLTDVKHSEAITDEEMAAAVEAAKEQGDIIPGTCTIDLSRVTIMQQKHLSMVRPCSDATFKVWWSTKTKTLCLFYKADDGESWELMSVSNGDIIEGRFPVEGNYAITLSW